MDDLAIARAIHVLAVVHWIGGVALVTTVILPAVRRLAQPAQRLAWFERIEGAFSRQAKFSVVLAGASGVYMTHVLAAWERFLDPAFWWMHLMVLVWTIFTIVLFVAEPLFLHAWFRRQAQQEPESTYATLQAAHIVLLFVSAIAVAAAVLGTHGAI